MLRKLAFIVCLVTFLPIAAGAQDLVALSSVTPAPVQTEERLLPKEDPAQSVKDSRIILAARDASDTAGARDLSERPKKTHSGLSFRDFVDVHFGDYRWVWWALAAGVLVGIHVAAAD